jgi:hypothetical protein
MTPMTTKRFWTILATLALTVTLLASAGCQPRVRGPLTPREDTSDWPQIQISDRDLQRRIAVRRPMVERDPAGLLFVTVPVRSTTDRELTIEYRSTFYDRNGSPVFRSTWFPVTMTPFTQQTIRANSTSNLAEDFQIDIRPAK